MRAAIITWVLWAVGISALLVITPLNAVIEGENPLVMGGMPKDWQELEKMNISPSLKALPYETNQTGVVSITLTPWGYIKQIILTFFKLTTFRVRTGDSYTDAILYAFLYLPVGLVIIYRGFIIVRGGGG